MRRRNEPPTSASEPRAVESINEAGLARRRHRGRCARSGFQSGEEQEELSSARRRNRGSSTCGSQDEGWIYATQDYLTLTLPLP